MTPSINHHSRQRRFRELWKLVGNTPMLGISYTFDGQPGMVYAKCEHYNLTGSIKDRMALFILEKAYGEGTLLPGNRIVEATSGNTGISIAAIGRALGHPVTILMPDWLSRERISLMRSFGADVVLVSKEQGGFKGCISMAENMSLTNSEIFLPRQFENGHNAQAHAITTGPEIWRQLQNKGLRPDAFVAGVGTGGTIMGVGECLRKHFSDVKLHPVEPRESPTLSTGTKTGQHRIQGISDEFIPALLDLKQLDEVIAVSDGDAILMAQQLASQIGIAAGISSGANIIAAILAREKMGAGSTVVTVLPDSNKKYLTTDLFRSELAQPYHISPRMQLTGYHVLSRPFNHY